MNTRSKGFLILLAIILLAIPTIATLVTPTTYHRGALIYAEFWDFHGEVGARNGSMENVSIENATNVNSSNLNISSKFYVNTSGAIYQGTYNSSPILQDYLDARLLKDSNNSILVKQMVDSCTAANDALGWNNTGFNCKTIASSSSATLNQTNQTEYKMIRFLDAWNMTDPAKRYAFLSNYLSLNYSGLSAIDANTSLSYEIGNMTDNFRYDLEWVTSASGGGTYGTAFAVSENDTATGGWYAKENHTAIIIYWNANRLFHEKYSDGTQLHLDIPGAGVTGLSVNTVYPVTLQRKGTNVTMSVFTNNTRTAHATNSPTYFTETTKTRYKYVVLGWNSQVSGMVESGEMKNIVRKY